MSTLGSFVFCKRAGVVAFMKQGEIEEEEGPRIPNLGYLPIFDEEKLEERFKAILPSLKISWLITACGLTIEWFVYIFVSHSLFVFILPALFPAGYVAVRDTLILIEILAILSRYKSAVPTPLIEDAKGSHEITWWGLVKAGYRPIKPQAPFVDEDLQLGGLPWRLLSNSDGHRIAVIKHQGGELKIRDSHLMRLAAYSHLIRESEKASANWGVVIDGKTLKGFAIRISQNDRAQALSRLAELRNVLSRFMQGNSPNKPGYRVCANCPFGYPKAYQIGVSESILSQKHFTPNLQLNRSERSVHSDCGDVFRWRPPHKYWEGNVHWENDENDEEEEWD